MAHSMTCSICGASWAGHSAAQARLNRELSPCPCMKAEESAPARESSYVAHSTEVRWIGPGEVPPDVRTWFETLSGYRTSEDQRTDRYLCPPGWSGVGVKVREGRFEIKSRYGASEPVSFSSVEGVAEQWTKWSVAGEPAGAVLKALGGPYPHWRLVEKSRELATYLWNGTRLVSSESRVGEGAVCVELAELKVGGEPHWTVCIELASSAESEGAELIRLIAGRLLRAETPTSLGPSSAMGYPEWLDGRR